MTLRQQQSLFIKLLPRLIDFAYAQGYELTGRELWRTQAQAVSNAATGAGIVNSLHCLGLAIDLMLFKNGVLLLTGDATQSTENYRPLGDYWVSLDPLARWGGNFKDKTGAPKPDVDHFSLSWGGVE